MTVAAQAVDNYCFQDNITEGSLGYICLNIKTDVTEAKKEDWCVIPAVSGSGNFPTECIGSSGQTIQIEDKLKSIKVAPNQALYLYADGVEEYTKYFSRIIGTYYTNNDSTFAENPPKDNIKEATVNISPKIYGLTAYSSAQLKTNCSVNCAGTSHEVCPNWSIPIILSKCSVDRPHAVPPPPEWKTKKIPGDGKEDITLMILVIVVIIIMIALALSFYFGTGNDYIDNKYKPFYGTRYQDNYNYSDRI
jgi:hypothetical protein